MAAKETDQNSRALVTFSFSQYCKLVMNDRHVCCALSHGSNNGYAVVILVTHGQNVCRFSKLLLFFSSARMAAID